MVQSGNAHSITPLPSPTSFWDRFDHYSVSVLQWLLNAETSHPTSSPPHRLNRFFTTLYSALRNPSRAVFQFYPSSDDQIQLITSIAQKAGFGGGVVVDYPNSKKAKKVFLCLLVGGGGGHQQQRIPKGLETEDERAPFEKRREKEKKRDRSGKRKTVKDSDWILKKKEVSFWSSPLPGTETILSRSYIVREGRKVFLETQNIPGGSGSLFFDIFSARVDSTCVRAHTIYHQSVMSVCLRSARGTLPRLPGHRSG